MTMLDPTDELLNHQTSRPMRLAGTSDHRFYDRHWFEGISESGDAMFIAGMGIYKNAGACDGFLSVQGAMRQSNVRVSRPLGNDLSTTCGPLGVKVAEPYAELILSMEEPAPITAQLTWTSSATVFLEQPTVRTRDGRVVQDSSRYDQVGRFNGWIQVDGQRLDVADWWGVRDHSWGVRPGVGGYELPELSAKPESSLHLWTFAEAGGVTCHFQTMEDGAGIKHFLDGMVEWADDSRPASRVVGVNHDIDFIPDTREWRALRYAVTLDDGSTLIIEGRALQRAWAYRGTGYAMGFDDGRGLGAPRGSVLEHDALDLTKPGAVSRGGVPYPPGHREQAASVTIDGRPGKGHLAVMSGGTIARYGLRPRDRR